MFTKPCARPTCSAVCVAKTRALLARQKYHSLPCFYQHKRDMGWSVTPDYTLAQRQASGRKGGKAGAATRRKAAIQRHLARVKPLIPEALLAKLTHRQQALLTLLLVRSWERGRASGVMYERVRRSRAFVAQKGTAAA